MTDLEFDLTLANAEIAQLKQALKNRPAAVFCADCEQLGIKDFATGYCKRGYLGGILSHLDGCTRGAKRNDPLNR